jgi:hypothetical protein
VGLFYCVNYQQCFLLFPSMTLTFLAPLQFSIEEFMKCQADNLIEAEVQLSELNLKVKQQAERDMRKAGWL